MTEVKDLDFAPSDDKGCKTVWHGEQKCEGKRKKKGAKTVGPIFSAPKEFNCPNGAYFRVGKQLLCGMCSKRFSDTRKPLPKMSKSQKAKLADDKHRLVLASVEAAQNDNIEQGRIGQIVLTRLGMRKNPEQRQGFLMVFPNKEHQNRKGFGCSSLSPMRLGPVKHGQPGLPDATNVENFHQGSKLTEPLVEDDDKGTRCRGGTARPGPKFEVQRLAMYTDKEPHRHNGDKGDVCIAQIWVDKAGVSNKLQRVDFRQFYCTFYARLAQETADYKKLVHMVETECTNIQIVGYDAEWEDYMDKYASNDPAAYKDIVDLIYMRYKSEGKVFGHEWVLFTMLVMRKEPNMWPWVIFKTFDF